MEEEKESDKKMTEKCKICGGENVRVFPNVCDECLNATVMQELKEKFGFEPQVETKHEENKGSLKR